MIDRTVRGSDSPQWIGDNISYFGLHVRIKVDRGRAAEHDCVDCGGQAAEWSYDHTGVDEKVSDTGMAYSTDTAQYSPRCKPCHGAFDSAQRASA
ncbi:hypothetical protein BN970_01349 [Mycolicibacterium conceptionense]|uniref:Uncharacterized protein n=1 Tax=Mycolicibacterium conceptionense TaxID=451644 RepID=A0A0U1D371_9MYCO|nr:hypothetical protein [Mycolicibacterium conceptionense]ORV20949.1 hypothetical protein AWB98_01225 [Mycolicibacterium conceptionense]CQD07188.1 hypothetical protein BN970_01349 [Mycolicibacterium conceptionense]